MSSMRRARIFEAWSDPEQLAQWWGPNGFTNTFHEFDFSPGGHWSFTMHGPDGKDYENRIVFEEIDAPSRIYFLHVSAPEFQVLATFDDLGGQTKVIFRMFFESAQKCAPVKKYAVEANEQNFNRLEMLLAKS